jgi:hypothetical protein
MSLTGAFNPTGCWLAAAPSASRSFPADGLISVQRQCMAPRGWHALPVLTLAVVFSSEIPSLGLSVFT